MTTNSYLVFFRKWLLLIILLSLLLAFFCLHLDRYLTLNIFEHYQTILQQWTTNHYSIAISLYMMIFILLVACATPSAAILTCVGGFLFGTIAILYALFSITVGSLILFLAVRTSIGAHIATKSSGLIKKMEHGFQQNAFRYLIMLRLLPICPSWMSNIAAGALNVPMKTFIFATLLGLLPVTCVLVEIGSYLD